MSLPRFDRLEPAKREAILAAARAEFAEKSFDDASLNRIILAAGVSKGSMYYYFADKADLYLTLLTRPVDRLVEILTPTTAIASPAEYWREWSVMLERTFTYLADTPDDAALFWDAVRARAQGGGKVDLNAQAKRLHDATKRMLRLGQGLGAVRVDLPDGLFLEAVFGMLEGLHRWAADHWQANTENDPGLAAISASLLRRLSEPSP